MTHPRFATTLRERRCKDGSYDRYWVVKDGKLRGFQVLRVNATYPDAETLAKVHRDELNRADEREKQ